MTEATTKKVAALLLVVGCAQMVADVLGLGAVKGLAAATMIAPAPKVFSSVRGLETYSTRFFLEWTDKGGEARSLEMTPELAQRVRGPYHRRNVYGAALAYGPVLADDPKTRPMLAAVLDYALCGDAPLLRELGVDPADVVWPVRIRFEPLPGTDMGDLPRTIEAPMRSAP
jgi:hypothetical protein